MNIRGYFSIGAVCTALMLGMAPAHAAYDDCNQFSPDVTGFVTGTAGCEIDDTIFNDSDAAFDTRNWFGFTDWDTAFDAKDDPPGGVVENGSNTSGLTMTKDGDGEPLSGDWSMDDLSAGQMALFVFKDGTQADPHALIVYLVDASSATSGTWSSPFFNAAGEQQATSHASVYLRQGGTDVPVAGTVWLMALGLGLIGLAGSRRRKA